MKKIEILIERDRAREKQREREKQRAREKQRERKEQNFVWMKMFSKQ